MTHISNITVITIIAIQGLLTSASGQSSQAISSWGRAIVGTRVVSANGPQLDIGFVTEESGELVSYWTLANVQTGTYKPGKLVIEGRWRHGFFWPTITSQVDDQYAGPWRTIPGRPGKKRTAKLILERGQIMTELRVSLEPFRKYIGEKKVGRIVLTSGDSGVFELNDLIPPPKPPSETSSH
jgi:hypothetical protein